MVTTRRGNGMDKKGKKNDLLYATGHKAVGCYQGLIELMSRTAQEQMGLCDKKERERERGR